MFLLYHPETSRTGRALRRALGIAGGFPTRYLRQREDVEHLIRWGSSAGNDAAVTINPGFAVRNAANKLRMLELLRDDGIPVPPFSTEPSDLSFPLLGRSRTHRGGSDIVIYMRDEHEEAMYDHHDFFTQYLESSHEIRFHVLGGDIIRAQLKRGPDHEGHLPIRNHENGYHFVPYVNSRPHHNRAELALRAVECLGLDFGSVDVLCVGRETYILEVNSSSGCSRPTAQLYAEGLRDLLLRQGVIVNINESALEVLSNEN